MSCVLFQTGCGPTYPKEIVDKAVVQLCREEYKLDVKAALTGTTIAVYLPIESLLDEALGLSEEARDKINDVVLSVSRVTLSTDAPIKFYIVIAQDPKFSEVEIVIIRYVDDIKLFHYNQISRTEFSQRALIELKLTPQAQKEKILKDIFEQLNIQETEEMMRDFLTRDISAIGDIGYWNNQFFIKEINLEEFLASQIAERSRRIFIEEPGLKERFRVEFIGGELVDRQGKKTFRIEWDIAPSAPGAMFISDEERALVFKTVIETADAVLHGYKFEDFEGVDLKDKRGSEYVSMTKSELEDFRKGKLEIGDIMHVN